MELLKLIKSKVKSKISIIIFSNTTKTCDFISLFLKSYNIDCIRLHGDMPFEFKKGKFREFQNGVCNILITTDAGARGLDTIHVQQIINYDFPLITSEYIHR
jgi:superfamily II DNA/RNA helicase